MASFLSRLPVERRRHLQVWLIAVITGCIVFFAWIGYSRTLDPTNLRWIFHEDPFTHVMGWEQFRNAPLLQYPITKNHLYGLEWSSTIVYSDSIPIVALALRPLGALLPHPFQYLGLWMLMSLVLQAYFAARLMLLRSPRLRDAAIAAAIFSTTPVLLERIGIHTALASQWLLLWALLQYFTRGSARSWLAILLLSVSVHAYLWLMVSGVWVAHLVRTRPRRREIALAAATLVTTVAWMHALGYFFVGEGSAGGGWRSSFDLAGFVAPARGAHLGVLPEVPGGAWDGSAYLGAGMLALAVASLVLFVRRRPAPVERGVWAPLLIVLAGYSLFAITNHITFIGHAIGSYPIPHLGERAYETFRGAARMIWPAYYVLLVGILWLAVRVWPARLLPWALAATLVIQLVDLEGVAAIKRAEVRGPGITRPLADPIWSEIPRHYTTLVSVPAKYWQADWETITWFAARNALGSNVAYVSRSDPQQRADAARTRLEAIASGHLDAHTVYYFPSSVLWDVARRAMTPQDLAVVADGLHLVLPGARAWSQRPELPPPTEHLGDWLSFSDADHDGLLIDGWWPIETGGTWSAAGDSWLVLPVPANTRVRVTLRYAASPETAGETARVRAGSETFQLRLPRAGVERRRAFEATTDGPLLAIHIETPVPRHVLPNARALGIGLVAARVERASDAVDDDLPSAPPVLDQWIRFAADAPGRKLLLGGWSWGEPWGTWSEDPAPELALPVPDDAPVQITFRWLATAVRGHTQHVRVWLNDTPFEVQFANDHAQENTFTVAPRRRWVRVRLDIADPRKIDDGRLLGVGLEEVRVTHAP